jgi:hypothetical protein
MQCFLERERPVGKIGHCGDLVGGDGLRSLEPSVSGPIALGKSDPGTVPGSLGVVGKASVGKSIRGRQCGGGRLIVNSSKNESRAGMLVTKVAHRRFVTLSHRAI